MTMTFELGGSLQVVLARFTLLNDAGRFKVGDVYWTEDLMHVDFRRSENDGKLRASTQVCRPDPDLLEFTCGGSAVYNEATGQVIGWAEDPGGSTARFRLDVWSLNVAQARPVGLWQWTTPVSSGTALVSASLSPREATIPETSTTVNMEEDSELGGGLRIVAVETYPEFSLGLNRAAAPVVA